MVVPTKRPDSQNSYKSDSSNSEKLNVLYNNFKAIYNSQRNIFVPKATIKVNRKNKK